MHMNESPNERRPAHENDPRHEQSAVVAVDVRVHTRGVHAHSINVYLSDLHEPFLLLWRIACSIAGAWSCPLNPFDTPADLKKEVASKRNLDVTKFSRDDTRSCRVVLHQLFVLLLRHAHKFHKLGRRFGAHLCLDSSAEEGCLGGGLVTIRSS